MKTLICPTCGCSLVRLGVSEEKAATYTYHGEEFRFCCQGCTDLFITDPQKYLGETKGLIVCPSCLAEKPLKWATKMEIGKEVFYFCHCPYCPEVFQKNREFYLKRLAGTIPTEGVLDHEGCCIRPE